MMMMKTEWITIYRILTEALELMGFENATDLNKQYEDKGSGLEFVLQQEVLLKGLMHFVQDTTHVDRSVEDTKLDDMIYNTSQMVRPSTMIIRRNMRF